MKNKTKEPKNVSDSILENYQIQKFKKEKTEFIIYLKERLAQAGYDTEKDITIETKGKAIFRSRNIVVGNSDKKSYYFYQIDIDSAEEIAKKYNIVAVPTIIIFKDVKELGRTSGYQEFEEFEKFMLDTIENAEKEG